MNPSDQEEAFPEFERRKNCPGNIKLNLTTKEPYETQLNDIALKGLLCKAVLQLQNKNKNLIYLNHNLLLGVLKCEKLGAGLRDRKFYTFQCTIFILIISLSLLCVVRLFYIRPATSTRMV